MLNHTIVFNNIYYLLFWKGSFLADIEISIFHTNAKNLKCLIYMLHLCVKQEATSLYGHLSIRDFSRSDFLSEGLIFVYQQPHYRINENQPWYSMVASLSLNTIAINVLFIDRVEDNTYSLHDIWPHPNTRTAAPDAMKVAILVDPSLVIIVHT